MENSSGKKKPTINISLFTTFSHEKPSSSNTAKSPRNFQAGVVGLGIVAAMTDLCNPPVHEAVVSSNPGVSPKSSPIPIVSSSSKATANFRGGFQLERNDIDIDDDDDDEVDELSESYTCVISHHGNNLIKKRVYYDDKLNGVSNSNACMVTTSGVFSASPANIGEVETEFWTSDFLASCNLCKKQLHGLDIFMYRGEKAFCSSECRDKHMRNEDYKDKCRSEAMKPSLDYSVSPCSSPQVFLAGVVAA